MTLRELVWMAKPHRDLFEKVDRQMWEQTSSICAMIFNCTPGRHRNDQIEPARLNPYSVPAKPLMMPLREIMKIVDIGCGPL